jgi:hypothetical protein
MAERGNEPTAIYYVTITGMKYQTTQTRDAQSLYKIQVKKRQHALYSLPGKGRELYVLTTSPELTPA